MSWIETFLFNTVWGIALLASPIFVIAWIFHKISKGPYVPYYIAGSLAFLILLTAPSIPRFLFEKRILEQTKDIPGLRLVNKTKWADIVEPITWFYTPYGYFRFVRPEEFGIMAGGRRSFREFIFRYKEKPEVYIIEVFCDDEEYAVAAPDESGVFRLLNKDWLKLDSEDRALFCDRDWTEPQEEINKAFLAKPQT